MEPIEMTELAGSSDSAMGFLDSLGVRDLQWSPGEDEEGGVFGVFGTWDEALPFDQIEGDHLLSIQKRVLRRAQEELRALEGKEVLSGLSLILAFEAVLDPVHLIHDLFINLLRAGGGEGLQTLVPEFLEKKSQFEFDIYSNSRLFKKMEEPQEEGVSLSPESLRLKQKVLRSFIRHGVLLADPEKEKLREIHRELALLGIQFADHLRKARDQFELVVGQSRDLMGLPLSQIEVAHQEAERRGHQGKWVFTLQASSYRPFLQFAENRELRKKLWLGAHNCGYQGEFDNIEIARRILLLRHQRAQVLGFRNHAEFVFNLECRIASDTESVLSFLEGLYGPFKRGAERYLQELRDFRLRFEGNEKIQPWDLEFLGERLRRKKYRIEGEELSAHFPLSQVLRGAFECVQRLYGLEFRKVQNIPVYHPDVDVYSVHLADSGRYMGLLYTDFFPRPSKQAGAWCSIYRSVGIWRGGGAIRRPHLSICCNFSQPTSSQPSLLSFHEVKTLFHELGHGIYEFLSEVSYRELSGRSVALEFQELSSQMMENWVQEAEGLDLIFFHHQTGETLSLELFKNFEMAEKSQSGMKHFFQLQRDFLDMKLHTEDPSSWDRKDLLLFEKRALAPFQLIPQVEETSYLCQFSHLFAFEGGYAAGYYSYHWAAILDSDAFDLFKEQGIFDTNISRSFYENILSRGDSEEPMELYKRFLGREPNPEAFLRKNGLV